MSPETMKKKKIRQGGLAVENRGGGGIQFRKGGDVLGRTVANKERILSSKDLWVKRTSG